jgi:hypothetical protein
MAGPPFSSDTFPPSDAPGPTWAFTALSVLN